MGVCYNLIKKHYDKIYANNIFEWAEKISNFDKRITPAQAIFALLVFKDLGLIVLDDITDINIVINEDAKNELTNSEFYNQF